MLNTWPVLRLLPNLGSGSMGMETLKWPTRCLSLVTRNAFLSGYMSGKIRLFSWPIFRQKSVPGMYWIRSCVFFTNGIIMCPKHIGSLLRIEWTLWTELRPIRRSRRFIFRNRENIPIRSLCRRWGVRKRMSMEVFWPGKNWPENWRSGFQVWMLLSKRRTTGMKYAKVGCLSLPIRHRKRILKV